MTHILLQEAIGPLHYDFYIDTRPGVRNTIGWGDLYIVNFSSDSKGVLYGKTVLRLLQKCFLTDNRDTNTMSRWFRI
jgi:hypothetical protein